MRKKTTEMSEQDSARYAKATKALAGQLRVEVKPCVRVAMGRVLELLGRAGEKAEACAPVFFPGAQLRDLTPAQVRVWRPFEPTGDDLLDSLLGDSDSVAGVVFFRDDCVAINPTPEPGCPGWMVATWEPLDTLSDDEILRRLLAPCC